MVRQNGDDVAVVNAAATCAAGVAQAVSYATGRVLDVYRPPRPEPQPIVDLLHACCGDRSDLSKLAEALAAGGAVALNADWGGMNGARYPAAYAVAACAVRYAHARGAEYGGDPHRVALLGWSDGALVAVVVALAGDTLDRSACRAQQASARPEVMVDVGGYYGRRLPVPGAAVTARAVWFLGGTPATAPAAWRNATPYGRLPTRHPPLRAVLLVGRTGPLLADARAFAAALREAGDRPSLSVASPAGDQSMISPRTAEGRMTVRATLEGIP